MKHTESHELAGKTVVLNDKASDLVQKQVEPGNFFQVEDWWDVLTGGSWMDANGNFAALHYAMRTATSGLPLNDEVVYGKIGAYGHLVHVSELGEVKE
jgi:hypothetical protein